MAGHRWDTVLPHGFKNQVSEMIWNALHLYQQYTAKSFIYLRNFGETIYALFAALLSLQDYLKES